MALRGESLDYTSHFDLTDAIEPDDGAPSAVETPDRRDGKVYEYTAGLKLAFEVALHTGRPLLLRGAPGTGKSSFAAYVARNLGWRYYEHVVTARTQAEDLLWRFDSVRRLADAQAQQGAAALNDFDYVEPGVLWWALERRSAQSRGARDAAKQPATRAIEPFDELNAERSPTHAVVLVDEIDKADPDVPNNLLVPLGSLRFRVSESGTEVPRPTAEPAAAAPAAGEPTGTASSRYLFVFTTNEERELPDAFLRRCVVHVLEHPDAEQLVAIAKLHFESEGRVLTDDESALALEIAQTVDKLRGHAEQRGTRKPSTAEYLDAVRACLALGVGHASDTWRQVKEVALVKRSPEDTGQP